MADDADKSDKLMAEIASMHPSAPKKAKMGEEQQQEGTPSGGARNIPSGHEFDPRALKPLAKVLYVLSVGLGHALSGYRQVNKLKSATISPDGMLGGRGFVMSVVEMRRRLSDVIEGLSSVTDTLHDEINAPHWRSQLDLLDDTSEIYRMLEESQEAFDEPEEAAEEQIAEELTDMGSSPAPEGKDSPIPTEGQGEPSEDSDANEDAPWFPEEEFDESGSDDEKPDADSDAEEDSDDDQEDDTEDDDQEDDSDDEVASKPWSPDEDPEADEDEASDEEEDTDGVDDEEAQEEDSEGEEAAKARFESRKPPTPPMVVDEEGNPVDTLDAEEGVEEGVEEEKPKKKPKKKTKKGLPPGLKKFKKKKQAASGLPGGTARPVKKDLEIAPGPHGTWNPQEDATDDDWGNETPKSDYETRSSAAALPTDGQTPTDANAWGWGDGKGEGLNRGVEQRSALPGDTERPVARLDYSDDPKGNRLTACEHHPEQAASELPELPSNKVVTNNPFTVEEDLSLPTLDYDLYASL